MSAEFKTFETEILTRINDIATAIAEEKIRSEERMKSMMEKIERALNHAHDAKNTANAFAVRVEIMEKDIRDTKEDISCIKEDMKEDDVGKKKNRTNLIIGIMQTITSATVIALLIFLWEHIYNK